uniref:Cysteine hydrolase n=1 Tax=Fervidicoccus fontis TaxID=683846 RepID=A0A7J3ZL47_9CREN
MLDRRVDVPEIKIESSISLPAKRTALIIVDMQNDFVKPQGRLVVPTAQQTIPHIKALLEKARQKDVLRIFTKDTHYPWDWEFKIWGQHTVKGTWGWEIVDELKPGENEIVIEKTRYDAFYGTWLDDALRLNNIEFTIITGTVANICVLHTAGSAVLRGYKVVVPANAVSALNDFDYMVALRQVSFLYRGIIVEKAENVEFHEGKE